ncbi:MAG: hypothetical protein PGN13_11550 [Patulibacter minatonensis]
MRHPAPLRSFLATALVGATVAGSLAAGSAAARGDDGRCADRNTSGTNCQEGNGRKVSGGGDKVSHKGWPAVTGLLWIAETAGSRSYDGTDDNDELLSHHASDTISGGAGNDIIWGDWDPKGNTTAQRDVLDGGAGADWIYTSHGTNTVRGGEGNDFIYAYYGHGTIDCGPGRYDRVKIRLGTGQYKVKNCETTLNFCAFGSIGGKRCAKPGERKSARAVR